MKKFRAFRNEIVEHEVVKETAKQIVYKSKWGGNDRRESKKDLYYSWHDTYDGAKRKLLYDAKDKLKLMKGQVERQKQEITKIKAL